MSENPDSVMNQGEFHARQRPSSPLEKGGHQPGTHHSPTDRIPTFSAETFPPGTAPANATYTPHPDLNNQGMYQSAASTLTGADSSDVHRGHGHPGQGMSSAERHHDGMGKRKMQPVGVAGHGGVAGVEGEMGVGDKQRGVEGMREGMGGRK